MLRFLTIVPAKKHQANASYQLVGLSVQSDLAVVQTGGIKESHHYFLKTISMACFVIRSLQRH